MPDDHRRQDQGEERRTNRAVHEDRAAFHEWNGSRDRRGHVRHRVRKPLLACIRPQLRNKGSRDHWLGCRFDDYRGPIRAILGDEYKLTPIWGLNHEGELRTAWRECGAPNVWYMMGL